MQQHPRTNIVMPKPRVDKVESTQTWPMPGSQDPEKPMETIQPYKELPKSEWSDLATIQYDAQKDPSLFSLVLPSKFHFYPFKTISAKPVTARQQAKFARAASDRNARYQAEGVSSLLGDNVNVEYLTTGDYYWLMYWLYLASYPSSKLVTTLECNAEIHIDKILSGELPESSLRQLHTYERPILTEYELDVEKLKSLDLSSLSGVELDAFRVKDMLAWDDKDTDKVTQEDFYIYDLAVYLKNGTLEERAEVVRDMSIAQTRALKAYREIVAKHGVEASINYRCNGCSTDHTREVRISVHDFL